jgi:hypothetical protein
MDKDYDSSEPESDTPTDEALDSTPPFTRVPVFKYLSNLRGENHRQNSW